MFCQKCGKYINDGSAFCNYCGTHFSYNTSKDSPPKPSVWEVVSVRVSPIDEQKTINLYQKMGWSLKNNQEINNSTTHVYGQSYKETGHVSSYVVKEHYVKLTFERDKSMPNYSILKNNYDMYC